MIHKIINILLIPLKVKYIKVIPFNDNKEFSRRWNFTPFYDLYINVGTILNPVWYGEPYSRITKLKYLYKLYKAKKSNYISEKTDAI